DVAQRPDAGGTGAQLVIDFDEAALVGGDARLVEAEVVRIGIAADGEQEVRAGDLARLLLAAYVDCDTRTVAMGRQALSLEPKGDTFAFEYRLDRRRHLGVLARDDARRHLDHGDVAAKSPVHLREFKADVAAADD